MAPFARTALSPPHCDAGDDQQRVPNGGQSRDSSKTAPNQGSMPISAAAAAAVTLMAAPRADEVGEIEREVPMEVSMEVV